MKGFSSQFFLGVFSRAIFWSIIFWLIISLPLFSQNTTSNANPNTTPNNRAIPNNVLDRSLNLGESFSIPVSLVAADDILVLSKIDTNFFTNIKSSRRSSLVEFELTVAKPGNTVIEIDNISQGLEPYVTYQIMVSPNQGNTDLNPGSLEASSNEQPNEQPNEQASEQLTQPRQRQQASDPASSNPLLVRDAYNKAKEIINSGVEELAQAEIAGFKENFPDAQEEYWDLTMARYNNFKDQGRKDMAQKIIEDYLSEPDNAFSNEAKLVLAQDLIQEKKLSEALKQLFSIAENSPVYPSSLLTKGTAYEDLGRLRSALSAYNEYLNVSQANFNSRELPELLPTLDKVGRLYRDPAINDFELAYSTYKKLLQRAEVENNFEFQNRAAVALRQLEKHYFNIR